MCASPRDRFRREQYLQPIWPATVEDREAPSSTSESRRSIVGWSLQAGRPPPLARWRKHSETFACPRVVARVGGLRPAATTTARRYHAASAGRRGATTPACSA